MCRVPFAIDRCFRTRPCGTRKAVFETIDQLQKELDTWIDFYNTERTHQGKMCCGRTPLETLIDGKTAWAEKSLD